MRFPRTRRFGRGRSASVAELHTVALQSRARVPVVALSVALTFTLALGTLAFGPLPADAQSTDDLIAQTREEIDATAQRWFASREEAAKLERDIAELERKVTDARTRADRTAVVARERALQIYKGSGTGLGPVLASNDALDSVRRAELLDRANEDGQRAIDKLETDSEELTAQQEALEKRRKEQASIVERFAREQSELEAQLGSLQAQAQREAALAAKQAEERAAAAARAQAQAQAQAQAAAPVTRRAAPAPAPAPPKPVTTRPARPVVATPPPASGGTHPHHDDPFLVCTRARESSGNYGVVSASGRYYGAYQFSPTTWDVAASHAGRVELIGVMPNQASAYDQDDLAWALYQWQGKAPWGGRC
jgi:peptidoglycan hydrolase CwlO-like protein